MSSSVIGKTLVENEEEIEEEESGGESDGEEVEVEEDEEEEDEEEEDDDDEEDDDEEDKNIEGGNFENDGGGNLDGDDDDDGNDEDRDLDDLEVSEDEDDFKKLENYSVIENLENEHPEIRSINFEEVVALSRVQRDGAGNIIDPLHMSIPFLTKYEKARIIGARAEQIDRGATPFVYVDNDIMNGRTIAIMEFEEKKIPFIVARPMPNKSVEYWRLQDLEYI